MFRREYIDDEEEEESEGWLASYSDLITDLLAVFVLLFSMALLAQGVPKTVSAERPIVIEGGVSVAEGGSGLLEKTGAGGGQGGAGGSVLESSDAGDLESYTDRLIRELKEQIANAGLEGKITLNKQGKNVILLRIVDSILFDTGKAVIKSDMQPALQKIGMILKSYEDSILHIHIEGHTDDRPISSSQFPSNWELSTGRAGSVVRFMIDESDFDPGKFSSAGYGEYRPIADNTVAEGRAQNRRVEFSIEVDNEPPAE